MQREVLRVAPWGPALVQLGKARKCQLLMADESASISNVHAELSLMLPMGGAVQKARLFVCDLSKNGTWAPRRHRATQGATREVNEVRISKGRLVELRDGDRLRFAGAPRYAVRRFEALRDCEVAEIPKAKQPEFAVPPCPHFIRPREELEVPPKRQRV